MFEESKFWIFISLLSALIGIGYIANYLTNVDSVNVALQEAKSKLANMHEIVAQRRKTWAEVEDVSVKTRELAEQNVILMNAKEVLDKRYRMTESDLKYLVDSMKTTVENIRNNASGAEVGDLTLSNGKLFRGAKIRRVEESGVSLLHSDGIGTVPIELLPNELKQRFDLGPDALLPQLQRAQAVFLDKVIPQIVDYSGSSTIAALKLRIVQLEVQLQGSIKYMEKLEKEVKDYEKDIQAADKKRAPTLSFRTMRDIAEGNAGMARNEVKMKKIELEKLKTQMESLLKKK